MSGDRPAVHADGEVAAGIAERFGVARPWSVAASGICGL
jgi:hypothetical protein